MNTQATVAALQADPERLKEAQRQLQGLLGRAATDGGFRARLLSDPRGALEEFSGEPAPADFNIVFVENQADVTLVLPDPVEATAELSEEELAAVAGGTGAWIVGSLLFIGSAALLAYTVYNADKAHLESCGCEC